jgi:hypothetical protein
MELYGNAGRLFTPASTLSDIKFDDDMGALARFEEAREWRSRAAYAAGRGAMEAMGLVVDDAESPKEDKEDACVYITTNARRTDAVYKTAVAYIKDEGNKGGK